MLLLQVVDEGIDSRARRPPHGSENLGRPVADASLIGAQLLDERRQRFPGQRSQGFSGGACLIDVLGACHRALPVHHQIGAQITIEALDPIEVGSGHLRGRHLPLLQQCTKLGQRKVRQAHCLVLLAFDDAGHGKDQLFG